MIPGSTWSFCSQNKDNEGYYQKVFNKENFVKLFKEQLVPNQTQPSVIILDNASYHKSKLGCTTHVGSMRKSEFILALQNYGAHVHDDISAPEAKLHFVSSYRGMFLSKFSSSRMKMGTRSFSHHPTILISAHLSLMGSH